ncbi:unnamed protein product, partial [Adineta ricciae]
MPVTDRKLDRYLTRIATDKVDLYHHVNRIAHLSLIYKFLQVNHRVTFIIPLKGDCRYLVVITCTENDESAILGLNLDTNRIALDSIIPIAIDLNVSLNGNGGFNIMSNNQYHTFQPINLHALWIAYQTLHDLFRQTRCSTDIAHRWLEEYYNQKIQSKQKPSCHIISNGGAIHTRIYTKLKEIMLEVNLDDVTTKFLYERLENAFGMSLFAHKQYIDTIMLEILAQMDKATEILPYLYLGSEWNASNFEELKAHGIGYVLNVSCEIENFFPEHFQYLNIRVHDHDNVDLLKEWERTYRFMKEAKVNHRGCLVHCKMGISRSASTVIAYLMKEYNQTLTTAFEHVKTRRSCVQPNDGFRNQLVVYEGILAAKRTFP